MPAFDYSSVTKYGFSSSMGNALEQFWVYKNGKFLEVEYKQVRDFSN